jgi:collagen type I alpha
VERIDAGARVRTHRGDIVPVIWHGCREVDCKRHPTPEKVWPVRIAPNTFGPGQPRRILLLSPDHAIWVDEVLIPVKHLIDGRRIVQQPVDAVTYHHLELPRHNVILADGLPVESYLDVGDHSLLADVSARIWEAHGCAPLIVCGPVLERVRNRLLSRGTKRRGNFVPVLRVGHCRVTSLPTRNRVPGPVGQRQVRNSQ